MDTTKTEGAGLTLEQIDELRDRQRVDRSDDGSATSPRPATGNAPIPDRPSPPAGKKRAGFTTNKGRGVSKAKRRMAARSRRTNRNQR